MKKNLTNLLILFLAQAISLPLFAQEKGKITGAVKDSLESPLMYDTVSLFKKGQEQG